MNRVLIFVDDDIFSKNPTGLDPASLYGSGLGEDIVTVSSIAQWNEKGDLLGVNLSPDELRSGPLSLNRGDRAAIFGKKAWDIFCTVYHNGLRAENGYDASLLDRLGINCGAFVKVMWKDKEYGFDQFDIKYFLSDEFVKEWDYSHFKQVLVSTHDNAVKFLSYFDSLDEEFGYDFETSGMPTEKYFVITGCAICTENYGAFFSFTDIHRNSSKEQYEDFLCRFRDFSVRHQSKIWAYNLQFEQQVNFRYFGTDLELCDASVYNIIEGYHTKRYSLKWTAQRVMNKRGLSNSGVRSWDGISSRYMVTYK